MQIRPYQEKIQSETIEAWRSGARRVLMVMPTGAGKTFTKADLIRKMSLVTCCIAHRQELVLQISESLASVGIFHNIIAPTEVIRFCVERHAKKFGRSFFRSDATTAVSAVQTLLRRQDKIRNFLNRVQLWDIDECFPAGTPVDGQPIEAVKVGDVVTAFDETTGMIRPGTVTRTFKRPAPSHMIRIATTHHVLICTPSHPIWTQRGWVDAKSIRNGDVLFHVSRTGRSVGSVDEILPKDGSAFLQREMFDSIPVSDIQRDHGSDEPSMCFGADESTQPDATRRKSAENGGDVAGDRSCTEGARRQRQASNGSGTVVAGDTCTVGVPEPSYRADRFGSATHDRTASLQDRLWSSDEKNCNRSGRIEPCRIETAGSGPSQEHRVEPVRVESVTILESRNLGKPFDGFVYNIEVDEFHTYTANGLIVHNCHHVLPENQWGKAVDLFPNAIGLGVTATPLRTDRQGLDRSFDTMVIGPTARDLIDAGYLTEYRIFCPPVSLDLSHVRVSDSTGEFVAKDLSAEVERSQIVGDVVQHYLRIAPGGRGLTFAVDLASAAKIADAFNAAGVPAAVVSGDTPDRVRADLLDRLARGDVKQLVNVDLFGEGMDCPTLEVVSMARPTQSYGLFVQQFGRVLRPAPGKTHGIVIDHVGNVIRHGLPDAPRAWSLSAPERRRKGDPDPDNIPITACTACFQPYPRTKVACPWCGNRPVPAGRSLPEEVDGDLIELDPVVLAQMRGEADRIIGDPQIPVSADPLTTLAIKKRWAERQTAQNQLREAIAQWAGVWKYGRDETDREIQRRFFHTFGIDIVSAQGLGAADADALRSKVLDVTGRAC